MHLPFSRAEEPRTRPWLALQVLSCKCQGLEEACWLLRVVSTVLLPSECSECRELSFWDAVDT